MDFGQIFLRGLFAEIKYNAKLLKESFDRFNNIVYDDFVNNMLTAKDAQLRESLDKGLVSGMVNELSNANKILSNIQKLQSISGGITFGINDKKPVFFTDYEKSKQIIDSSKEFLSGLIADELVIKKFKGEIDQLISTMEEISGNFAQTIDDFNNQSEEQKI